MITDSTRASSPSDAIGRTVVIVTMMLGALRSEPGVMRMVLVEVGFEGVYERSYSDVIERSSSCLGRRFETVAPKCAWPGVRARTSISEASPQGRSDRDLQTISDVSREQRRHRELTHDALRDHVSLDRGQLEDGADVVPGGRQDVARRNHVGLVPKFAKDFHRGLQRHRRCEGQAHVIAAVVHGCLGDTFDVLQSHQHGRDA